MNRVEESLKWLGIDTQQTMPMREKVFIELVSLAKRLKRPVKATEIARVVGRHRNNVLVHLGALRDEGRAHNITNGWIPQRP